MFLFLAIFNLLVQVVPSPVYPTLHSQVKVPGKSVHWAFVSQGLEAHSSTSTIVCIVLFMLLNQKK